jgi:hypothetical protein
MKHRPSSTLTYFAAISCSLFLGLAILDSSQASPPPADDEPTVEKTFKNIKVLQGLPTSQLRPVMSLMGAALGVNCAFCHVQEENHKWNFESDANPHKDIARRMITMTKEINKNFFKGRTVVSCNTCHRGSEHPVSVPSLAMMNAMAPEEGTVDVLPSVEDLLARYQKAIGGEAALKKLQNRVVSGNLITQDGKRIPVEIRQRRPDHFSMQIVGPNGTTSRGYNGTTGWSVDRRGARRVEGADLRALRRESAFLSNITIGSDLKELRVRGTDSVNGRAAVVLEGRIDSTTRQRFYFDEESWLLLRRLTLTMTPIGEIPQQIDYDDYRPADGIRYPFSMRVTSVDPFAGALYHFEGVRHNVTIGDTAFVSPVK